MQSSRQRIAFGESEEGAGDEIELVCAEWPGPGRPIVALHGLTASHVTFVGVAERLDGRRRMIAPDLRGRGDSGKPRRPSSLLTHARDVAAALRALGLDRCVLVGHSMGAYVATALAAEHPELVAGLVLLDGGLIVPPSPGVDMAPIMEAALVPLAARLGMTFASREHHRRYWRERGVFGDADWSAWIDEYLDYDLHGSEPNLVSKADATAVREDFFALARSDEIEGWLRRVRVPALAVCAEFGFNRALPPVMPEAALERLRLCLPGVVVEKIAGTTHYTILLAEPGATRVAERLLDFAARCEAP